MTDASAVRFVCPKCRRPLRQGDAALQCENCRQTYPIIDGITNFITEGSEASRDSNLQTIKTMEFLAPIYETWLWQQFILRLAGARGTTLQSIARFVSEALEGVTGSVLDVACGPATYGRRIASPERSVYGIDFSMGTLRQGMVNIARDGNTGIHLARTRVQELPFEDCAFDGAICCGSLHLFPDTSQALREIGRTMKPGAPLVVTTFVVGNSLMTRMIRRRRRGMQVRAFELPALQQHMAGAGFEQFEPVRDGDFITFSTRKAIA